MANISKLVEDFLKEYLIERRPYVLNKKEPGKRVTTIDELIEVLSQEEMIIRKNSDKTPEEIVEILIKDTVEQYSDLLEKYGIPGYAASSKVGNIDLAIFAGKTSDTSNEDITEDTLFDIASMTKFYTQIVIYNLIKEGTFKRSDKIKDIDKRFSKLDNVTVDDILRFGVEFYTPGKLDADSKSTGELLDKLFNAEVAKDYKGDDLIGKHCYTDIGLMIMKEVIESTTQKSFEYLINKYIVEPLHLKNTYLIVPDDKLHLMTASPNADIGYVTDMKANILGGFSGHAGIKTNYSDIQDTLLAAKQGIILPPEGVIDSSIPSDLYGKDIKKADGTIKKGSMHNYYGKMGNVLVPHPGGVDYSFADSVDPIDTTAIAGSTRTNAAVTKDSAYTVLFNPSSVSQERAKELIEKLNVEREQKGMKPIITDNVVNIQSKSVNGKEIDFNYVDPRAIMGVAHIENAVRKMAELTVKLRFLNYVLITQEKYYDNVTVKEHVGKR